VGGYQVIGEEGIEEIIGWDFPGRGLGRDNTGTRGAFRVAACVRMSLRRGATLGDIGTLTLVTPSSPEKLKGHVQSPAADYSATPIENPVDSYGQTDAKDTGMYFQ